MGDVLDVSGSYMVQETAHLGLSTRQHCEICTWVNNAEIALINYTQFIVL